MNKNISYASKYIIKWLFISTLVGIGGGVSAVFLKSSINYLSNIIIGIPFWIAPAIGGFIVCLLFLLDKNISGFGTDKFIYSINKNYGELKIKTFFSKLIATTITLGFGGSGGVTGPMLLIGGSFSKILSKIMMLDKILLKEDRRLLTLCGAAGAIGAIFRSPLGGGIFVVEILYKSSLHYTDLFPAVLSSTMGFIIYSMITSDGKPLFIIPDYLPNVLNVPLFILVAIIAGMFSILFMNVFSFTKGLFKKLPYRKFHPLIGGVITGLILIITPEVSGIGLDFIQEIIVEKKGIIFLLIILIGKIFATSFTVASGNSAGLVIPSLFIGGISGNLIAGLINIKNSGLIASLTITGMSASLAATVNVPIAAAVMLTEMVGLRLGVPAVLGSILGYAIGHSKVIYGATSSIESDFIIGKEYRKSDRRFDDD